MRKGIVDEDLIKGDYYQESALGVPARISAGMCVACGWYYVEGYYCEDCATRSKYNSLGFDDRQAQTATRIGKIRQRAQERSVEMEDVRELMGSSTNSEVHRMRARANGGAWAFTTEEHAKIDRVLGKAKLLVHRGGGFSTLVDATPAGRRKERIEREAQRWAGFCESWFALVERLTSPDVTPSA